MTRTRTWLTTAVCPAPLELRAHLKNVQEWNRCPAELGGVDTAAGLPCAPLSRRRVTGRTCRTASFSASRWPTLAC